MYAMTAAHKPLPLGTWVSVRRLDDEKKITVRVNDRGPFVQGRIIDLSYTAAKQLGMVGPEQRRWKWWLWANGSPQPWATLLSCGLLQRVIHFSGGRVYQSENAERLRPSWDRQFANAHVVPITVGHGVYRVRVGSCKDLGTAEVYEKYWPTMAIQCVYCGRVRIYQC